MKKRKIVLWYKTFFSDFIELYITAEDKARKLKQSEDDFPDDVIAKFHKYEDLIESPQEFICADDDELIDSMTPSNCLDLFNTVFPSIEEAKIFSKGLCNLYDLFFQYSSDHQTFLPDDFETSMLSCFEFKEEDAEKDASEIKQLFGEYIEVLQNLFSSSLKNEGSDCASKHEKSIVLNKNENNIISNIVSGDDGVSGDETKSSGDFDFSYLPGRKASLSENYKLLISRYFKEFPLWGTKRIKIGHPYTNSPILRWYGCGFSINGVMLWCDDSMVNDDYGGISGLIIDDKRFECTCLPRSNCNAELCTLKSIAEKNGVISLNDGQFRFDFVMLNDEEYYFIYHLFERIVAFNKQNNITSGSNYQYDKCDFVNRRMNMSLGRRFTSEVYNRICSGNHSDDILIYSTKSPERWNRALSYICPGEKSENVYLVMDDTLFQSCKAGLVMTDSSIWLRPAFSSVHERIYLKDIKSIGVERKTFIINGVSYQFNLDKPVCPMSGVLHNIANVNNKKLIPYTARKGLLPPNTKCWYGEK